MEIAAGRELSGRYRLVRPLGQGSQASVWVAEHLALTTQVAVKLIDPELAKREDARERFRREATAAAQLRSAHVVQMLDHGIDGDQPFIVMELLDGEDLFERLDKRGRLTLRETSRIVTQVARALARAHAAGIVHRDLKPENVFLVSNEDDEVVKVFDFGVAKVSDPTKAVMQKTSVGQLIGTPHYMSPEQVKGTGEIDFHVDLWALGVITFQCVTGGLPFDSEGVGDLLIKITLGETPTPSKILPGLPSSFDAWFAKACHRDIAQRFDSARELAEALARAVRGANDAPGVASIPRPGVARAAVPVTRSTPPPSFEQSGRHGPMPVPGAPKRPEVQPAPAADKKAPALPAKRAAAAEQLGSDDLEEIMSFDEEAPLPAPPARPTAPQAPQAAKPPAPPAPAAPPPDATPIAANLVAIPEAAPPLAPVVRASAIPPETTSPPPPAPSAPTAAAAPPPSPSAPAAAQPPPAAPELPLSGEPPWARPARPPQAAPPAPVPEAPSSVPAFGRSDLLAVDAPPEFDGSRRKRLTRFFAVGLVAAIVIITWVVISSQIPPRAASPESSASAVAPLPLPPKPPEPVIESDAGAIDPIKAASSASAKPTTKPPKGPIKSGPVRTKPKPDDMSIEIPDVPPE